MGKLEVSGFLQFGQAVLFQCGVVIGIEAIHAEHLVTPREKFLGGVHADKPSGTGEHDFHETSFF